MSEEKKELKQENKALIFKLDGGKFVFQFDPNKDGEPVAGMFFDASELPDEVLSLIKNKGE